MLKTKSWKLTAMALVVFMMSLFCGMAASAASYDITPHEISSQGAYLYYNGNGYSIASGKTLSASFTLDNEYQYSVGYQSVTSGKTTICKTSSGTSASFSTGVPKTDLYKVYLKNRSSVTMRVTGGSISFDS